MESRNWILGNLQQWYMGKYRKGLRHFKKFLSRSVQQIKQEEFPISVLTYHGCTLPYAYCTRFDQAAEYDESGTDWYCTKFDIQVECVLNTNYLSQIAPDLSGVAAQF